MLAYAARRLLAMMAMLVLISIVAFVVIQLPPGDFLTTLVAGMEQGGAAIDQAHLDYLQRALRSRSADLRPVLEVDLRHRPARRFRPLLRVGPAGRRPDLGAARPHAAPVHLHPALHLGDRLPDRRLLGGPPVFARRLFRHVHRLHRPGDPELPAGARSSCTSGCAYFGQSVGGLFSPEFADAPWAWGKVSTCSPTCGSR